MQSGGAEAVRSIAHRPGTFYKSTRENGRDFYTDSVDFAGALLTGEVVRHPSSTAIDPWDDSTYISVSATHTDVLGNARFPYRVFVVEPVGTVVRLPKYAFPTWRGVLALKVLEELHPHSAFGPNGADVFRFLSRIASLTSAEIVKLGEHYLEPRPLFRLTFKEMVVTSGAFAGGDCARRWAEQEVLRIAPPGLPEDVVKDAAKAVAEAAQAVFWRNGGLEGRYIDHLSETWLEAFGEPP